MQKMILKKILKSSTKICIKIRNVTFGAFPLQEQN